MTKGEMMYEGKAKKVYSTGDPNQCIVSYKDDATAFNGLKKGSITGKGVVNNKMSNYMFRLLEAKGVPTHYIEELSDRETLVQRVQIVPLEVIVRNIVAGSLAKKLGVEEGTKPKITMMELSYKDDELGDPMINEYHAVGMGYATREELDTITELTFKINEIMVEFFKSVNIELVDYKLEFGRCNGTIVLADEISPDTCRLWDIHTHEKLDKDRFRRDMGGIEEAYAEVFKRIGL